MEKRKESDIQKAILQWLNLQDDTFAFKVHSTGIPIGTTGKFRKNFNKGVADIIGVKKRRFFALEVKTNGRDLEDHQRSWLKMVANAGGYACKVESLEDVIEAFKEI